MNNIFKSHIIHSQAPEQTLWDLKFPEWSMFRLWPRLQHHIVIYRSFGGTCCLHSRWKWHGDSRFLQNILITTKWLHSVATQKIITYQININFQEQVTEKLVTDIIYIDISPVFEEPGSVESKVANLPTSFKNRVVLPNKLLHTIITHHIQQLIYCERIKFCWGIWNAVSPSRKRDKTVGLLLS
jgi:hypothetical protein